VGRYLAAVFKEDSLGHKKIKWRRTQKGQQHGSVLLWNSRGNISWSAPYREDKEKKRQELEKGTVAGRKSQLIG